MRFYLAAIAALFAIGLVSTVPAGAETPRQIGWEDLVPEAPEIPDPFDALSTDDQIELGLLADLRHQMKLGYIAPDSDNAAFAQETEDKLKARGIEAMLKANDVYIAKMQEQSRQLVTGLDGETVRMPGYALPLEFTDKAVRRLLLVPYVGACVHSPPPPPNQLVVVELTEPYKVGDIFEPVWITGKLEAAPAKQSFSYVDGQIEVESGYLLNGTKVELYEN